MADKKLSWKASLCDMSGNEGHSGIARFGNEFISKALPKDFDSKH